MCKMTNYVSLQSNIASLKFLADPVHYARVNRLCNAVLSAAMTLLYLVAVIYNTQLHGISTNTLVVSDCITLRICNVRSYIFMLESLIIVIQRSLTTFYAHVLMHSYY